MRGYPFADSPSCHATVMQGLDRPEAYDSPSVQTMPERSASAPAPHRQCPITAFATERLRRVKKRTVENSTVVVREFNQSGFRYKTPKLNQLTSALAPFHDPRSLVVTGLCPFRPSPRLPQPPCSREVLCQRDCQ